MVLSLLNEQINFKFNVSSTCHGVCMSIHNRWRQLPTFNVASLSVITLSMLPPRLQSSSVCTFFVLALVNLTKPVPGHTAPAKQCVCRL